MALDPLNTSVSPGVMSTNENDAERSSAQESEEQPLLRSDPVPATWSPPPGFLLIQIGMSNENLYMIEQILTIQQPSWPMYFLAGLTGPLLRRPML